MNDRPESADAPQRPADASQHDELEGTRMTFGEHLTELRSRLIKALLATLVTVVAATAFADELMRLLLQPFQRVMREIGSTSTLAALSPTATVITYFKISLIVGAMAAAPVWIWQIWAFIGAGLYKKERRWVLRFAPLSLLLFAGGVVFGYLVLLPVALKFLLTFPSPDLIQNWITIDAYFSLFSTLTLLLGGAFQLPVIMLGLAKAGIISAEGFRKKRKITILLIFIVAGILTPPDPVTQPLVAVPLCFLYELGIALAWFAEGGKRQPVDWKRWRKRAVWIAVIAAAIFVFRKRLVDVWGGYDANQRLETPAATKLPWQKVGQLIFGQTPEGAIRINDDAAAPVLAVAAGGKAAVVRFVRSTDPVSIVTSESRDFRAVMIPAGAIEWKGEMIAISAHDALWHVVEALRTGNEESRKTARVILAAATGLSLPADDAEAARAAGEWVEARRDQPFAQPR
jgi:sec-independent protein translocase protein TatC